MAKHGLLTLNAARGAILPASAFLLLSALWYMMPSAHQGNARLPPVWSPEQQERYPFRQWSYDVMIWSIINVDLNESRKAAAVVSQLRGAAAEFAREIPPQIIIQG